MEEFVALILLFISQLVILIQAEDVYSNRLLLLGFA